MCYFSSLLSIHSHKHTYNTSILISTYLHEAQFYNNLEEHSLRMFVYVYIFNHYYILKPIFVMLYSLHHIICYSLFFPTFLFYACLNKVLVRDLLKIAFKKSLYFSLFFFLLCLCVCVSHSLFCFLVSCNMCVFLYMKTCKRDLKKNVYPKKCWNNLACISCNSL